MQTIKTAEFQRALGAALRHEAKDFLEEGIETVPPQLFVDAVETLRDLHGPGTPITVNAVVDYEMRRVMKALGAVNQPKGALGHGTLSRAELQAAMTLDPAIGSALTAAYNVVID